MPFVREAAAKQAEVWSGGGGGEKEGNGPLSVAESDDFAVCGACCAVRLRAK